MTDDGERLCACGCGKLLPANASKRRKYLDGHRDRAYRKRVREAAREAHLPERLSLSELAQASTSTHEASADADSGRKRPKTRRPRQGVSVYFRNVTTLETLAVWIAELRKVDLRSAGELGEAEATIDAALTRHAKRRTG